MRRFWDVLAGFVITALLIRWMLNLVKPYVPYFLIAVAIYLVARRAYNRYTNW